MNIISRNFKDIEIFFSTEQDKNLYINATKIAKQFFTSKGNPKDVSEWLNSKSTKEYIAEFKKYAVTEKIGNDDLVIVVQGGKPQEQGTWIHKKLIIAFARWLSPEFAVWCDIAIEEILETCSYQLSPETEKNPEIEKLSITKELEILKFKLENYGYSQKEKIEVSNILFKKVGTDELPIPRKIETHSFQNSFSLTKLLEKHNVQIRAADFNTKLAEIGIIENRGKNCTVDSFSVKSRYFKISVF